MDLFPSFSQTGGGQAIVQQPFDELDEHFSKMSMTAGAALLIDEEKRFMKKLQEMDLTKQEPGLQHMDLLAMIACEENWEPEYYPLPRRSTKGEHQGDYFFML